MPHIHPLAVRTSRKPHYPTQVLFNRLDAENPDLNVEEVIKMTASALEIPPSLVLKRLWG